MYSRPTQCLYYLLLLLGLCGAVLVAAGSRFPWAEVHAGRHSSTVLGNSLPWRIAFLAALFHAQGVVLSMNSRQRFVQWLDFGFVSIVGLQYLGIALRAAIDPKHHLFVGIVFGPLAPPIRLQPGIYMAVSGGVLLSAAGLICLIKSLYSNSSRPPAGTAESSASGIPAP